MIVPRQVISPSNACVVDEYGAKRVLQRLRLTLDHATRNGATLLHILTDVPRQVSAKRVAQLYRHRWTLEHAFQHFKAYFHSDLHTLVYPKAALFGFCLALVAYNVLAVM
jgi:IS4 transposase